MEYSGWIYRFRGVGTGTAEEREKTFERELNAIRERKFWFSSIANYNDPFEFILLSELERFGHQGQLFGGGPRDREFWLRYLLRHGVCCFCMDSENGPINQLMWAHYAQEHFGFAIGLQTENFEYPIGRPITYSATPHKWDDSDTQSAPDQLAKLRGMEKQLGNITYRKHECWKYENEFRILNDGANLLQGQYGAVKWPFERIYFGARMTAEHKCRIRDAGGSELEYLDSLLDETGYSMKFRPSSFELENTHLNTYFGPSADDAV